jgi:vacuolar-type H+-ATPase subunit C/Vma6
MGKNIQKEYEKDFYAWTVHNVKLLREGKLSEADVENIAEEIESMGKRERRELINQFAVLIAHLLKWAYQPARRSKSWEYTIKEQRFELIDLLDESPSLKHEIKKQLSHAYEKALLISEKETGFELKTFPKSCPFTLKQVLNQKFFPKK